LRKEGRKDTETEGRKEGRNIQGGKEKRKERSRTKGGRRI
jgi:hypothetical protein